MVSPTQRVLPVDQVRALVAHDLGVPATAATPLTGGSFGSLWRVSLADGDEVVLKLAPDPATPVLTYEKDLGAAEAEYLALAWPVAGVPTPALRFAGPGYVIMSALPGVRLCDIPGGPATDGVRERAGAAIAHLHGVTGSRFGYSGARPHGDTWPEAFGAMVGALLADAEVWGVALPVPARAIEGCLAAHRGLLAGVTTAHLLHFDLWDGNLLVDPDSLELTGLVDGERYLWGDPLVDFASPALFRDMFEAEEHPFLRGYRRVRPLTIDEGARRRAWLYQLYLYLLMIVEYPSRGMDPTADPHRWEMIAGLVRSRVERLSAG